MDKFHKVAAAILVYSVGFHSSYRYIENKYVEEADLELRKHGVTTDHPLEKYALRILVKAAGKGYFFDKALLWPVKVFPLTIQDHF